MDIKEIEKLVRFHENSMIAYGYLMSPESIYIEKATIDALKELKAVLDPPPQGLITRTEK